MKYEKEEFVIEKTEKEKQSQIIQNIINTRNDLNKAHINFNSAENDLIDFYTYQIKALQSKLDYLTKIAKTKKLNKKNIFYNYIRHPDSNDFIKSSSKKYIFFTKNY